VPDPLRFLVGLAGRGRFPDPLRAELEAERVEQIAEGLFATVTLRGYRGPDRVASYRKQGFAAAVAVTRRRLVVWSGSKWGAPKGMQINVGFDDPRFGRLEIAAEAPGRFLVACQFEDFHDDRSGRFEVRLHTPKATELAEFALAAR
jgi:hypothetical protein